jgi:hypothetical protein
MLLRWWFFEGGNKWRSGQIHCRCLLETPEMPNCWVRNRNFFGVCLSYLQIQSVDGLSPALIA